MKIEEPLATALPRVLFMCDFPPSDLRGGSVVLSRLLSEFAADDVVVLAGSSFTAASPAAGRLCGEHVIFPTTNETGRFGWGRIKTLADWALIPALAMRGASLVRQGGIKAILTVSHGHFFVGALLASRMTGVPYILIVHDDWVHEMAENSVLIRLFSESLFRTVGRNASHVYAVSPYMQQMLEDKYQVASELQMPATDLPTESKRAERGDDCLRIAYSGTLTGATTDPLQVLVNMIKNGKLAAHGVKCCELHLYVMVKADEAERLGWNHPSIKFHGWASQEEMQQGLKEADLLYLPYGFGKAEKHMTMVSFPSKTADYLKSGTPIVIFAPPYSGVAKYAKQHGFAEIVDEPDVEKLAAAIGKLAASPEAQVRLTAKSIETLKENHDIQKQRSNFRELITRLAVRPV